MALTEEERERAITLYKSRQEINRRHQEKQRAEKDKNGRTGRPVSDKPTDEQLEQLLLKRSEKCAKMRSQRNPQTREDIIAVIEKLNQKLQRLEQKEMVLEDKR